MTKEKLLERCDDNYEIKPGVDIVVFQAAIDAMQEYADQETSALRAENERLRGLIKQMWYWDIRTGFDHLFDNETKDYWYEKFKTENNL